MRTLHHYTAAVSCRTGERHLRKRLPCQDRWLLRETPGGIILALADGHGDARCIRAGFGARMACAAAADVLSDPALAPEELGTALTRRFAQLAERHLRLRPLGAEEAQALGGLPPIFAYGATLIAARADGESLTLLQVGDGAVHALRADGSLFPAMEEDPNNFLNVTASLADAEARVRWARYEEAPAALLAYTDGYCHGGERPAELLGLLAEALPETLPEDILHRGDRGDDQTVAVLRSDALCGEAFLHGLAETRKALADEARRRELLRTRREIRAYLETALGLLRRREGDERAALEERIRQGFLKLENVNRALDELLPPAEAAAAAAPCIPESA